MKNEIAVKLIRFIEEIGIPVSEGKIEGETIIPGIFIKEGGLIVDEEKLTYPGDLLHEAGHLAVKPSSERQDVTENAGNDPAEEMMAILWSWAAAVHLKLDPKIVFHDGGYKGGSDHLIKTFKKEAYIGLPMLQWIGLAADRITADKTGVKAFPSMIKWMRD